METTRQHSPSNFQLAQENSMSAAVCVPRSVLSGSWTGLLFRPERHLWFQNSSSPPRQRPAAHEKVDVGETAMMLREQPINKNNRYHPYISLASDKLYITGIIGVHSKRESGKTCVRILRMSLSVWLELICPSRSSAVRRWEAKLATLLPS